LSPYLSGSCTPMGDTETVRRGLLFYARSRAPIKIDAGCSGTIT
jgi:hypothetical protein